jgi:hypothetical protein
MRALLKPPEREIPLNCLPPKLPLLNVRGLEKLCERKVFIDPERILFGLEKFCERNVFADPERILFGLEKVCERIALVDPERNLLVLNRFTLDDEMLERVIAPL